LIKSKKMYLMTLGYLAKQVIGALHHPALRGIRYQQ
jgi:hypothetical protein